MLSKKFIAAVKLSPLRSYQIAHLSGMHPSTLSKLINGIERVVPNDPRILKVAEVLGLTPEECFDQSEGTRAQE